MMDDMDDKDEEFRIMRMNSYGKIVRSPIFNFDLSVFCSKIFQCDLSSKQAPARTKSPPAPAHR